MVVVLLLRTAASKCEDSGVDDHDDDAYADGDNDDDGGIDGDDDDDGDK